MSRANETATSRWVPKFDIGARIVVVHGNQKQMNHVQCPICDGRGRVTVPGASSDAYCPECDRSTGRIWLDTSVRYFTMRTVTVGQVQVTVSTERPHRSDEAALVAPGQWRTVRYMADETGVGSGHVYSEPLCFPDEAEAEAFAASKGWVTEAEAKAPAQNGSKATDR